MCRTVCGSPIQPFQSPVKPIRMHLCCLQSNRQDYMADKQGVDRCVELSDLFICLVHLCTVHECIYMSRHWHRQMLTHPRKHTSSTQAHTRAHTSKQTWYDIVCRCQHIQYPTLNNVALLEVTAIFPLWFSNSYTVHTQYIFCIRVNGKVLRWQCAY
jgi:hypothetical protein